MLLVIQLKNKSESISRSFVISLNWIFFLVKIRNNSSLKLSLYLPRSKLSSFREYSSSTCSFGVTVCNLGLDIKSDPS